MEARLREDRPAAGQRKAGIAESTPRHIVVRLNTGSLTAALNSQTGSQYATVQAELTSPVVESIRNAPAPECLASSLPSLMGWSRFQ